MAIRQPPSSIKDANLRGFLSELRNAIGKTGEQVNQVAMRVRQITNTPPPPTEPPDPGPPGPPGPPGEPGDGLAPPAPIDLTTTSDAWAIRLTWEQPADMPTDYDVTEIWCRNATSGDKHLAGSLRGNSFVFSGLDDHLLETGETWYFWVRNKDVENLFSAYYPNNDVGVSGQALPSPTDVIGDITSDIVNGTLFEYLGAKVALLQGPEGLPGSVSARLAEQKDQLVQQINEISVSSNGTIDTAEIWHFDTTAQGWTVSGTGSPTVAWSNGVLVVTAGSATATVLSPTISVSGPAFHFVRARLKQTDTNEVPWTPTLAYKKSGSSTVYTYTPVTPAGDLSGFVEQDWEVADEETPVWTVDGTTITQVGFQLAAGQQVRFDWVAVGRLAPGASYSQVEAIRVRSDKKNRVFYQTTAPTDPYTDGYNLVPYDLWFDIDDGNKPYRWNPPAGYTAPVPPESPISTHWAETTDKRLADSWAEIYDISTANANPSGAAAQRINGIAANATSALATGAANTAAIQNEATARANGDAALSQQINQITAGVNYASRVFIQGIPAPASDSNYTLKTNDLWYDTSVSGKVTLKYWDGDSWEVRRSETKTFYKTAAPTVAADGALLEGDLWFDTDDNNKPYIRSGSSWVSVLEGYINTLADAKITTFEQTKVGYATVTSGFSYNGVDYVAGNLFDNNGQIWTKAQVDAWNAANTNPQRTLTWNAKLPIATAIKQVRVSDGTDNLTIEAQFAAKKTIDNQLLGQYSVKIDNNGWVSGFGLSSEPRQDGSPFSEFGIRADRFWIAPPSSPGNLPSIGVGLADLPGTVNGVIGFISGRLTSAPTLTTKTYAYFQPADLHGLSEGEWFTLKNIRASSTTTSDNYHTGYNGSFVVAKIQRFIYTGTSGSGTVNLPYVGGQTPILFEAPSPANFGYKTSQTSGQYSDPPKLIQQKYLPFIVTTTQQTYNGATVPEGVFMNNAYIANATITNAKIADAAITSAKIAQSIQSNNYSPGAKTGWIINKDGNVEFNNGVWRGTLQSDPFVQGSTGWQLQADGDAEFNSVIVRSGAQVGNNSLVKVTPLAWNFMTSGTQIDVYLGAVVFQGVSGRTRALLYSVDMVAAEVTTRITMTVRRPNGTTVAPIDLFYKNNGATTLGAKFFSCSGSAYANPTEAYWDVYITVTAGGSGNWGYIKFTGVEIAG